MNIYINVFLVDIQLANGNAFFIFEKIGVIDIERGLVSLDYFYGQAGELFSFYRIPKALFQEQRFQSLSTDAKTLYGILLDRMSLSVKNGWLDEQNRVFIIFTIEDVKRALCCADNKATKLLRELEKFGLIERKRRGRAVYKYYSFIIRGGDGECRKAA